MYGKRFWAETICQMTSEDILYYIHLIVIIYTVAGKFNTEENIIKLQKNN